MTPLRPAGYGGQARRGGGGGAFQRKNPCLEGQGKELALRTVVARSGLRAYLRGEGGKNSGSPPGVVVGGHGEG